MPCCATSPKLSQCLTLAPRCPRSKLANKVEVLSKNNEDYVYAWTSESGGSVTITKANDSSMIRGTRIVLHIKEDMSEYLEEKRVTDLVKKHSEFFGFPIKLYIEKTTEKEVTDDEEDKDDDNNDSHSTSITDCNQPPFCQYHCNPLVCYYR